MNLEFFASPAEFRLWLEEHHESEDVLWVGYYKKHTGLPSLTWEESVDQALCFGWIDGLRKTIDDKSYRIRFTPRRKDSNWSAVNLGRVKELKKQGLMKPAGLQVFEQRKKETAKPLSGEDANREFERSFEKKLKQDRRAWTFFQSLAPSNRKASIWWVVSAKREETRDRRFGILVESCRNEELIPPLDFGKRR